MKRHSFSEAMFFLAAITTAPLQVGAQSVEAQVPQISCFKPWIVPDRWDDANANGVYDVGEFYDPVVTGYSTFEDIGAAIALKLEASRVVVTELLVPIVLPTAIRRVYDRVGGCIPGCQGILGDETADSLESGTFRYCCARPERISRLSV